MALKLDPKIRSLNADDETNAACSWRGDTGLNDVDSSIYPTDGTLPCVDLFDRSGDNNLLVADDLADSPRRGRRRCDRQPVSTQAEVMHNCEVRPRKDKRGADLISDGLPAVRRAECGQQCELGLALSRELFEGGSPVIRLRDTLGGRY